MNIVHIVGRSKNGKTELIINLVREMKRRGIKVGTLKHSGHAHDLDKPGKDSYRHREAGAEPAAIATTDQMAAYLPRAPEENPFDRLAPLFDNCDIILVEGYSHGPGKNIEVWRSASEAEPVFREREDILAVVTDDPLTTDLPVWPRQDVKLLVDRIMEIR